MSTLSVDKIQGQTIAENVKMPAGSILQTVTKHFTDPTTISDIGTTYTDITNGTIIITPRYYDSKILIIPNISWLIGQSNSVLFLAFRLKRLNAGGTSNVINPNVANDGTGGFDYGASTSGGGTGLGQFQGRHCGHHVDTPGVTSAVTYKFQGISYTSGTNVNINYAGSTTAASSSIVAMEISV